MTWIQILFLVPMTVFFVIGIGFSILSAVWIVVCIAKRDFAQFFFPMKCAIWSFLFALPFFIAGYLLDSWRF